MTGNKGRGMVLQERDRHLLRELGVLRVVDRDQAKTVAGFGSDSRVNRRLRTLTDAGLLTRFFLGTRISGQKAIYSLSKKGALLAGVARRGLQRRKEEALIADFFAEHQLAVNDFYCDLKYRRALPHGVAFEQWQVFDQPITSGSRLIPDGYFVIRSASRTIAAFVEVDLGHERRAVWHEKVRKYSELATSGEYVLRFGHRQFRVLVITTTERRLESLQTTAASTTSKLFRFTTLPATRAHGPYAAIWRRAKSAELEPLIEESLP
jgi:DNA-binding transcriptional ArsR family regulator